MGSANCGWLFYKKPFLSNSLHLKEANEELLATKYIHYSYPKANHANIKLKTIYPGLVIGSGYMHSMKEQPENFDFGFYFDYTTGMPVIPGSSVKGVLRSLFGQNEKEKYPKEKECLIQEFVKEIANIRNININELFKEIFEGIDRDGKAIPMHKRDKFFDAFISSGDKDGFIFADDSITPHENPLKDPVPNRMLKIRPEVEFTFVFELHDFCDKDGKTILSAEQKEELFLQLLQFNGVGAKTNVGYGQFEEADISEFKKRQEEVKKRREKQNLKGFERFLAEIEGYTRLTKGLVAKIKNYSGTIEDIQKVKEIIEKKEGDKKFKNRIINYLDSLNE